MQVHTGVSPCLIFVKSRSDAEEMCGHALFYLFILVGTTQRNFNLIMLPNLDNRGNMENGTQQVKPLLYTFNFSFWQLIPNSVQLERWNGNEACSHLTKRNRIMPVSSIGMQVNKYILSQTPNLHSLVLFTSWTPFLIQYKQYRQGWIRGWDPFRQIQKTDSSFHAVLNAVRNLSKDLIKVPMTHWHFTT